jgi:hypothetical protein
MYFADYSTSRVVIKNSGGRTIGFIPEQEVNRFGSYGETQWVLPEKTTVLSIVKEMPSNVTHFMVKENVDAFKGFLAEKSTIDDDVFKHIFCEPFITNCVTTPMIPGYCLVARGEMSERLSSSFRVDDSGKMISPHIQIRIYSTKHMEACNPKSRIAHERYGEYGDGPESMM